MRRPTQLNRLNAASLARWVVMTALLPVAGLSYVYLTLQLHWLRDRQKALETPLAGLRKQNDVANVQIATLTARSALQRRLKEGYLKMVPITDQTIVRLAPIHPAPEENANRPVANDQVGKRDGTVGRGVPLFAFVLSFFLARSRFVSFIYNSLST